MEHTLQVHNGRAQERGEGKARKTLGAIMSVFICCWVPFFLLALLKPYGVMPPRWFDHLALWLGYSNRFIIVPPNPFTLDGTTDYYYIV